MELIDNGLYARAAHTNAGPDRIDGAIVGEDRDFRAGAGVAGDADDLDNAFINFRHFLREELRHELRMSAGKEDLATARFFAHIHNIGADTVTTFDIFARKRLVTADDAFGAAEIYNDMAIFNALHDTIDNLADTVFKFEELTRAFSVAHLAHNDLFRHLRLDAAKFERRQCSGNQIPDFHQLIIHLGR